MSMTDIRIEDITPQLLEMARALFREKWRRLKELPTPVNHGDFFDGLDLTGDYTVALGSKLDSGRGVHVRQGDNGWFFLPSEINEARELLAMSLV